MGYSISIVHRVGRLCHVQVVDQTKELQEDTGIYDALGCQAPAQQRHSKVSLEWTSSNVDMA